MPADRPAGRATDAEVAEKVMGLVRCQSDHGGHLEDFPYCFARLESPRQGGECPQYSTDWSAMQLVVERMAALGWDCEMEVYARESIVRFVNEHHPTAATRTASALTRYGPQAALSTGRHCLHRLMPAPIASPAPVLLAAPVPAPLWPPSAARSAPRCGPSGWPSGRPRSRLVARTSPGPGARPEVRRRSRHHFGFEEGADELGCDLRDDRIAKGADCGHSTGKPINQEVHTGESPTGNNILDTPSPRCYTRAMNNATKAPATLLEAIQHFADPDASLDFVVGLRWPDGIACPHCEAKEPSYLKTRRIWKCRECRKQFSVKVGTIFEDSPIGLDKWLPALWMLANCKNGISSYELARGLGVTQKTSWFMLHRIRLAMQTKTFRKIGGVIEVDETYMGGKAANMHPRRKKIVQAHPLKSKTAVVGVLKRGAKGTSVVRAVVRQNVKRATLQTIVSENVRKGSLVCTDSHPSYRGMSADYLHAVVDHSVAYVKDRVHTNGLENFWSLLKRTVRGTYVSVDPGHLSKYVDEQVFRYNSRKGTDHTRFLEVVGSIFGRRLTYSALIQSGEWQTC